MTKGNEKTVVAHWSRNPFETFVLCAFILSGVAGLFNPSRASPSVHHVMAEWQLYIWYSGLTTFGGITLAAHLLRTLLSYYVERSGLMLLSGLCGIYSVAVVISGGTYYAFAALTVFFVGLACAARAVQINHEVRVIRGSV